MASRRPLVNVSGSIRELPTGDTLPGVRELLTAARTYYVRTDGSDSNTGLNNTAGGAFATIQKAVDTAVALDGSIYQITISVAAGTYSGVVLKKYVGSVPIAITGDTTTPANVTITTTAPDCILGEDVGAWKLGGLKLQNTTGGTGLHLRGATVVAFSGTMEFGACSSRHMFLIAGARLSIEAPWRITGSSPYHISASVYSFFIVTNQPCTLVGSLAFSASFLECLGSEMRVFGVTFTGSATGARYYVAFNGLIRVYGAGANYLPGDAAGSTDGTGIYL